MEFPGDWPSDCPPADAEDAAGEVFRVVKNDPASDGDLATHRETGKLPNAPACLRCGLSVFRNAGEAIHQRELLPKLGSLIAKATLQPIHGKCKLTAGRQPTHTTWWPYVGVNRTSLFSVIKEEG
jgi:hypothetical protein